MKQEEKKIIDIIIMSFNRQYCLQRCLESVAANTLVNYQMIIVDPGSTDGSREWLFKNYNKTATLIFEDRRWSYAQSNNNAFRYGRSKYVALLNDDCEVREGWLKHCIEAMENDEKIGHAAHVVLRADANHLMSAGANLMANGNTTIPFMDFEWNNLGQREIIQDPEKYGYSRNVAYAGFGVYRRDLLERVGYLPEFPVVIYWDDTDYGMKINALGYDVRLIPESVIVHYLVHSNREMHPLSANIGKKKFIARWGQFLKENNGYSGGDPRPYLSRQVYQGEKYNPLSYAVEGKPGER